MVYFLCLRVKGGISYSTCHFKFSLMLEHIVATRIQVIVQTQQRYLGRAIMESAVG